MVVPHHQTTSSFPNEFHYHVSYHYHSVDLQTSNSSTSQLPRLKIQNPDDILNDTITSVVPRRKGRNIRVFKGSRCPLPLNPRHSRPRRLAEASLPGASRPWNLQGKRGEIDLAFITEMIYAGRPRYGTPHVGVHAGLDPPRFFCMQIPLPFMSRGARSRKMTSRVLDYLFHPLPSSLPSLSSIRQNATSISLEISRRCSPSDLWKSLSSLGSRVTRIFRQFNWGRNCRAKNFNGICEMEGFFAYLLLGFFFACAFLFFLPV